MRQVNMHEAKTQLSKLVDAVAEGREEGVIIAKDGTPRARIMPIEPKRKGVRIGIAKGEFVVPESIDRDNEIIERMFYGEDA